MLLHRGSLCETTFPVGKQKLNDAFSGITYINYNKLYGFADKISYERMVIHMCSLLNRLKRKVLQFTD